MGKRRKLNKAKEAETSTSCSFPMLLTATSTAIKFDWFNTRDNFHEEKTIIEL